MKTKSPQGNKSRNKERKIYEYFRAQKLNKLAIKSGYKKRSNGKISAKDLILGFMMMASKKKNTYESWSQEISLLSGSVISRQAVEERMRIETTAFLKLVLEEKFKNSIQTRLTYRVSRKFNHIKLEDSTIINLPEELSFVFPGNVSHGKRKSQAKIHALYDFTENTFDFMHIHSFTQNDQSLSMLSLGHINQGDLLLRDMGFLVLDALDEINARGAYFISPKSFQINVYDPGSKEKIDLAKVLAKQGVFDREVLVGKKHKKMRLVIFQLPQKLADERKRKAHRDRDKRLNHNKEYYQLLGYSIFITNIPQTICSAEEVSKLYGLRWQIEIVFKSWKSGFSLEKLTPSKCNNPDRIYCMIYLWLIFILLFHTLWINSDQQYLKKNANLSILKLANFFSYFFQLILIEKNDKKLKELMLIKCRYDKRKDRINLMQKYEKIAA
jgi:hypothetical protein